LQTPRQKQFSRGNGKGSERSMILYPDFFKVGDFGLTRKSSVTKAGSPEESLRWEEVSEECSMGEVASSLLLVKAMGAHVTPHLYHGVTHILCDLNQDMLHWNSSISISAFGDSKRGEVLHQRLLDMEELQSVDITLVSLDWVRGQWD